MIKIDMSQLQKNEIIKLHKRYSEEVILPRVCQRSNKSLEKEENKDLYDAFIGQILGGADQNEKTVKYCISENLTDLIKEFEKQFKEIFKFSFKDPVDDEENKVVKDIRSILDNIFDYNGFNKGATVSDDGKDFLWNRHLYVVRTGVKVCPYCNREYVTSYVDDDEHERTTADVDHYYPKSLYPYLQMNINNMIPSCNICNSKMKGRKDTRHLNPYVDSTDSMLFKIPFCNVDNLYSGNVEEVLIDDRSNSRAKASIEIFKLDKIYQTHTDEAEEVFWEVRNYKAYRNEKLFYKEGMGLEIKNSPKWFRFLEDDPLNKPLIKMKQDIYRQLMEE